MKRLLCAAFLALAATAYSQDTYWSEDPASILARAKEFSSSLPGSKDVGIHILLDQSSYSLRSGAIMERRYRMIYVFNAASGLSSWASISVPWNADRTSRPEIRARVISPGGTVSELDQATIGERPWEEDSPDIYTNMKRLSAPLPNCVLGAVVQYEIVLKSIKPFFDAGESLTFSFGSTYPTNLTRLDIDYDQQSLYRVSLTRPEGILVSTSKQGELTRVSYSASLPPLWDSFETMAPRESLALSTLRVATGTSWEAVAKRYAELSEPSIQPAALGDLALERAPGESELAFAERCRMALVRKGIRYTALHYGDYGLVPAPNASVIQRGYGDCKDQAALLTAMLRAQGIPASLALLATGRGLDAKDDLPGMGLFDHAIVYVAGASPFWVDPSARYYPAGRLPPSSQGRMALVVALGRLEPTPMSTSADNRIVEIREIDMAEEAGGEARETTTVYGAFESEYRAGYTRSDRDKTAEHLAGYMDGVFGKGKSAQPSYPESDDYSGPFILRLSSSGVAGSGSANRALFAYVKRDNVFTGGMPGFSYKAAKDGGKAERRYPLLLDKPFSFSIEYRLRPPPGYVLDELPKARQFKAGPATYREEAQELAGGELRLLFSFDSGSGLYSPAEYAALYKALSGLYAEGSLRVTYSSKGETALAEGRYRDALAEFQTLRATHPTHPLHQRQVARVLAQMGLRSAAKALAAEAVAAEPDNFIAWIDQALVARCGSGGTHFGLGWDRGLALSSYLKADSLDPGNSTTLRNAAIVCGLGEDGQWLGLGSDLQAALDLAGRAEAAGGSAMDIKRTLLEKAGRYGEAAELLKNSLQDDAGRSAYLYALSIAEGAEAMLKKARSLVKDMKARNNIINGLVQRAFRERPFPDALSLLKAVYADLGLPLPEELSVADRLLAEAAVKAPFPPSKPEAAAQTYLLGYTSEDPMTLVSSAVLAARPSLEERHPDIYSLMGRNATLAGFQVARILPLVEALWKAGMDYAPARLTEGLWELRAIPKAAYRKGIGSTWPSEGLRIWVLMEEGQYRVAGSEADPISTLACADALIRQGLLDQARALLQALHAAGSTDKGLRKRLDGSREGDAGAMTHRIGLALAYMPGTWNNRRAKEILDSLPPPGADQDEALDALSMAERRLGQSARAAELAGRISPAYSKSAAERAGILGRAGCFAEAGELLKSIKDPADLIPAEIILSDAIYHSGDSLGAFQRLDTLVKHDYGAKAANDEAARILLSRNVANERSWFALMADVASEELRRELEGLVKNSPNADFAVHTLICLYAATGKPDEALSLFQEYSGGVARPEDDLATRFARAMVVESFGLTAEARAEYQSIVERWKGDQTEDQQMVEYALRRLSPKP
jgi:transglutaminase-like putative cysteine protease/tetratricopeptide (TPR) repeat protein